MAHGFDGWRGGILRAYEIEEVLRNGLVSETLRGQRTRRPYSGESSCLLPSHKITLISSSCYMQVCRAPTAFPSPMSLPASSHPVRSHSRPRAPPCLQSPLLPHHSAGYDVSLALMVAGATPTHIKVPRDPRPDDNGFNLTIALQVQYCPATGLAQTHEFVHEFTGRVYAPAYDN